MQKFLGSPDYHVADKDVSTGSCRPHQDVDDGKGPQNVIPKSDDDRRMVSGDSGFNGENGDKRMVTVVLMVKMVIDDLCAPMHASIHPNSISGSMSEL